MMKQAILQMMEKALNAYLHLDPESSVRLKPLVNKVVTIEFMPFSFIWQCIFTENKIQIQLGDLLPAEVKITGTPLQLLSMVLAEDRQQFFADDVKMEGNAEVGQQVIDLFDRLDIDWEEYMSQIMGDIPAHQVSRVISRIKNFSQHVRTTLTKDCSEYLHEEAAICPSPEELQDFFQEIDDLRMDVDRLEARIKQVFKKNEAE